MFHVWLARVKISIFKVTQQLSELQVWCICKWDLIAISNPYTVAALQVISHTVGVGHTEWVIKLRISQANISKWLEHLFHYCIKQTFLPSPSLFFLSGCCQLIHLDLADTNTCVVSSRHIYSLLSFAVICWQAVTENRHIFRWNYHPRIYQ